MLTILAKALSSLLTLCLALLLLLAVYVSVGRQLVPFAADYRDDIEQRLSAALGQQVQIGSVQGDWRRFNPVLTLRQVLIFPETGEVSQEALQFDNLSLELDVWSSLSRRQWTLANVGIQGPSFTLGEQTDGSWQLLGFEGSGAGVDPDQVLALVSRVGYLSLSDLRLELQHHDGRGMILDRGRVRLQSRGGRHFLHADAWQDDAIGPLSLAAELTGNSVDTLEGSLYLLLPPNDYSELGAGSYAGVSVGAVEGSVELWVDIAQGRVHALRGTASVGSLSLHGSGDGDIAAVSAATHVSDLTSRFFLRRQLESAGWEMWIEDLSFAWNGLPWRPANLYARWQENGPARLIADTFNVSVARGLITELGLLDDSTVARLREVNPRGELRNLQMDYASGQLSDQISDDVAPTFSLTANLADAGMDARRGAPALWGIDGYVEMHFHGGAQQLRGMVEVDSVRAMIHLPDLFQDSWAYDHVNGRVNFTLDLSQGVDLRLASSVITAESEIIDGRVQFATHYRHTSDEDRTSTLELLVGGLNADLAGKSLYLPTGPKVPENARNVMSWLQAAVIDGHASNSGLIYRGSVLAGSRPEERTLQMYYNVDDGVLQFDPQWPALEGLHGRVVISDREADIRVDAGQSLGMDFSSARATIRPDEGGRGSWVSVNGAGSGATGQGMQYLRETPVTRGFSSYLSQWQATGELALDLALRIPLGVPEATPQADVAVRISDSTLLMPELDLDFDSVEGALQFNTATGLQTHELSAVLFNQPIEVVVTSTPPDEQNRTTVEVTGAADVADLRAWPRQSGFVQALLGRGEGSFDYAARVEVDSSTSAGPTQRLTVSSDLRGVALDYPVPLDKSAQEILPLELTVDFRGDGQDLQVSVGDVGSVALRIADGDIRSGLVFLGQRDAGVTVRRLNANAPGLDVLGSLAYFNYDDWMRVLREPVPGAGASANPAVTPGGVLNLTQWQDVVNAVDLSIDRAVILGQEVPDLNLQIVSEASAWRLALSSEVVQGTVQVPYGRDPLMVALDHLHLPAPPEEEISVSETDPDDQDQERVDPLLAFDPRTLPRMRFTAAGIRRGDADWGSWQFDLTPGPAGAEFTDLIVTARGLRVGKEGEEARFVWSYDDGRHYSHLNAIMEADNIADVLSGFGYAPSLESSSARFQTDLNWPGSPAFFSTEGLSGNLDLRIDEGRFLQVGGGAANSALKLISIINFDALVRRLRFSDDLLRRGLSYEQIYGSMRLERGIVQINDRLQIIGPASLFQVAGSLNLPEQTIDGSLYITLPVSDNIPWMSGIAVLNNLINWQVAVGVFLFDQIFGDQVDSLTSAEYTLQGPWEGLEPKLKQVFGAPQNSGSAGGSSAPAPNPPATPGPTASPSSP